jgi:hypothetical protein
VIAKAVFGSRLLVHCAVRPGNLLLYMYRVPGPSARIGQSQAKRNTSTWHMARLNVAQPCKTSAEGTAHGNPACQIQMHKRVFRQISLETVRPTEPCLLRLTSPLRVVQSYNRAAAYALHPTCLRRLLGTFAASRLDCAAVGARTGKLRGRLDASPLILGTPTWPVVNTFGYVDLRV